MTPHHHHDDAVAHGKTAPVNVEQEALHAEIEKLQQEAVTLREGLESRQRIGFVTGLLGQRYGLDPDQAWTLLARVSQGLNVKARRVAEVVSDVYRGQLDPADAALAADIARLLPDAPTSAAPSTSAAESTGTTPAHPLTATMGGRNLQEDRR